MVERTHRGRTLAVRLDSDGDVLLTGPALRALRVGSAALDLLVSPAGRQAADLLPGIDSVLVFDAPWSGYRPAAPDSGAIAALVEMLRAGRYDDAVIFTSFHQSPLPMALLARMAGIRRVSATSEDYPGSLLDVRHRRVPGGAPDLGGAEGGHEVEAAVALAAAAGFPAPPGDDLTLRLGPLGLPDREHVQTDRPYVVVHPTASVPARSLGATQARAVADRLADDGWHIVVTGGRDDPAPAHPVVPPGGTDLVGRTSFAALAHVLAGAECLVAVNTGPAHLAAAVGTPVVSLFAPVVPAARWAPWGVPTVLLGDQGAPCRGTRARECPVPGHPCLDSVSPDRVSEAVHQLVGVPALSPTADAGPLRGDA